jgi:DNA (cytosine-5)-methyltransferase 1
MRRVAAKREIPVIDLFAGAGGISVGARLAGGEVRLAIDIDEAACKTLASNPNWHGDILSTDVCSITGDEVRSKAKLSARDPLIIVGGPPCQPFSKAAYWSEGGEEARFRRARAEGLKVVRSTKTLEPRPDQRRNLVFEFLRVILETRADAFVFENVPTIKHPRNIALLESFKRGAQDGGYILTEVIANAAEFGVAQTRQRVFLLGCRHRAPRAPTPTNSTDGCGSLFLPPAVTARDAIERYDTDEFHEPEEVVVGRWAQHLREVPPGGNYKVHTAWAGHPKPTFVTETRFWHFLLKLAPNRPAWTIAASPGPWTGPFHWKNRRLRTTEMAALQGLPENYIIAGSRWSRVKQIGNAVPPPLAKAMVRSVIEAVS